MLGHSKTPLLSGPSFPQLCTGFLAQLRRARQWGPIMRILYFGVTYENLSDTLQDT